MCRGRTTSILLAWCVRHKSTFCPWNFLRSIIDLFCHSPFYQIELQEILQSILFHWMKRLFITSIIRLIVIIIDFFFFSFHCQGFDPCTMQGVSACQGLTRSWPEISCAIYQVLLGWMALHATSVLCSNHSYRMATSETHVVEVHIRVYNTYIGITWSRCSVTTVD